MKYEEVVAFVGEDFRKRDDKNYCHSVTVPFLEKAFENKRVVICSSVRNADADEEVENLSAQVKSNNFEPFPFFNSTKGILLSTIKNPSYLRDFIARCDVVIDRHPRALFWVRNPSLASLIFSLRVIKCKKPLVSHFCADITQGWKNEKYSFIEKLFGAVMSYGFKFMMIKVAKGHRVVNLCTGDALLKMMPKGTCSYQYVDVPCDLYIDPSYRKEKMKMNGKVGFLYVGRVLRDKGVFDIVKAASMLKEKFNFHVDIVGSGECLAELKKYTHDMGVDDVVTLHGGIANIRLSEFYSRADCLLVPSKNSYEGFPRVIMEAWQHHLPVIVSEVGGVKAFVRHEENGLLIEKSSIVSLSDAMKRFNENNYLKEKLRKGARDMAPFSSSTYWLAELHKILNKEFREEMIDVQESNAS